MKDKTYVIYLKALAISVAILLIVLIVAEPTQGELAYELCKMLMQFMIIVIIGGGIKYAVDQHTTDKENRMAKNEYLRDILEKIANNYANIKRIRRELKTDFAMNNKMSFDQYRNRISEINDIQLELEVLNEDLGAKSLDIPDVSSFIKKMEEYLKSIIDGFRDNMRGKGPSFDVVSKKDISQEENGFISEERDNPWFKGYVKPFREVRNNIRSSVLGA